MRKTILSILSICLFTTLSIEAKNYLENNQTKNFIDKLVSRHEFSRNNLNKLFANVKYQQTALSFYNKSIKPLPKKCDPKKGKTICISGGSWDKYSHNILRFESVYKGKAYMNKHKKTLHKAYKKYGIPAEYITAIIGIESFYGKNVGKYPVFDTLTTLSFEENRRKDFFKKELKAFLLMCKKERIDPKKIKGSYAGAIGLGQFMPSNLKKLAIDFNHDGKISLNHHEDAIGSIAHYLKKAGWRKEQEVAIPASFFGNRYNDKKTGYKYKYEQRELKKVRPKRSTQYRGDIYLIKLKRSNRDELWLGTTNFYAITRYNHSDYYAMAVHHLAQKLMGRSISQPSNVKKNIFGDTIIEYDELNNFLNAPIKRRKFIIDL